MMLKMGEERKEGKKRVIEGSPTRIRITHGSSSPAFLSQFFFSSSLRPTPESPHLFSPSSILLFSSCRDG